MIPRPLVFLAAGTFLIAPALGGIVARDTPTPPEPPKEVPEKPEAPKGEETKPPSGAAMEKDKLRLDRLITELQHSPRSFIYLRSIGFTETDEEFDKIIAANSAIFRRTRIVRRDPDGNRQIPGWPGITLQKEYKVKQQ